jgi:hypothetical protein
VKELSFFLHFSIHFSLILVIIDPGAIKFHTDSVEWTKIMDAAHLSASFVKKESEGTFFFPSLQHTFLLILVIK